MSLPCQPVAIAAAFRAAAPDGPNLRSHSPKHVIVSACYWLDHNCDPDGFDLPTLWCFLHLLMTNEHEDIDPVYLDAYRRRDPNGGW